MDNDNYDKYAMDGKQWGIFFIMVLLMVASVAYAWWTVRNEAVSSNLVYETDDLEGDDLGLNITTKNGAFYNDTSILYSEDDDFEYVVFIGAPDVRLLIFELQNYSAADIVSDEINRISFTIEFPLTTAVTADITDICLAEDSTTACIKEFTWTLTNTSLEGYVDLNIAERLGMSASQLSIVIDMEATAYDEFENSDIWEMTLTMRGPDAEETTWTPTNRASLFNFALGFSGLAFGMLATKQVEWDRVKHELRNRGR